MIRNIFQRMNTLDCIATKLDIREFIQRMSPHIQYPQFSILPDIVVVV